MDAITAICQCNEKYQPVRMPEISGSKMRSKGMFFQTGIISRCFHQNRNRHCERTGGFNPFLLNSCTLISQKNTDEMQKSVNIRVICEQYYSPSKFFRKAI